MPHSRAEEGRRALRRAGEWLLKLLSLFVILEPIWMLLPFAGFLYGSVLRIEALGRNPATAWLTHFVFPVLTLGWLGPILVLTGFAVFCVGAARFIGPRSAGPAWSQRGSTASCDIRSISPSFFSASASC